MTTFASAAHHYAAFRPHYPEEFFTFLTDRFGLDGTQTALDLGCGPGTITLPLASLAGHVHAVDIEPAMIREGRKAAASHGAGNITWACGDAAGLTGMGLPPLDLCTMGKSFQWMNQDRLLADLDTLIRPGGGIALVSTGPRPARPGRSGSASSRASAPTSSAPTTVRSMGPSPTPPKAGTTPSPAPRSPTSRPPAGTRPSPAPWTSSSACSTPSPIPAPPSSAPGRPPSTSVYAANSPRSARPAPSPAPSPSKPSSPPGRSRPAA
ncbi:class I SAM-dependent methyltransferase [Streptomyces sp. NPDC014773]|uniref:class I SAM-dependent methyltransferase n=1 Tax=Streptomyces sp. NPDC014773 TaxID=3364908 RepID=UPI0037004C70